MEEEAARLALLQTELNTIQAALRNYDSILLQIKGWCVTTALAVGGFAVAYHKSALILVGLAAVLGFFMINCQYRVFQRTIGNRNRRIDAELKGVGIMQVLKGAGNFDIVGTVVSGDFVPSDAPFREKVRKGFPVFWLEVGRCPFTGLVLQSHFVRGWLRCCDIVPILDRLNE